MMGFVSATFGGVVGYLGGYWQANQFSDATYSYYLPPDGKIANQQSSLVRLNSTNVYQDPVTAQYYADAKSVYREPNRFSHTDIAGAATGKRSLSTFDQLLAACGCDQYLEDEGPYTVFAPTDTAFDKLDQRILTDLLDTNDQEGIKSIIDYHIVPGELIIDQFTDGQTLETRNGKLLVVRVKNGIVTVNGTEIRIADVVTQNGIIHTVDSVLMPLSPTYESRRFRQTAEEQLVRE